MAKWTPRVPLKDAPKQPARYQTDLKALLEDALEYAVLLGMEPTKDTGLLWIAEEALTAGEPEGWAEHMDTHYAVLLDHLENGQASEAFCGKPRCSSKGTEFAIYDDSKDLYGLKTGKPCRELGIISYRFSWLRSRHLAPSPLPREFGALAHARARHRAHEHVHSTAWLQDEAPAASH
jgi:hypothetical protein